MKRFVICLLVFALALCAFTSCAKKNGENAPEPENIEQTPLTGAWMNGYSAVSALTEEEKGLITGALLDYDGLSFTPVAILASQLVAGTNYAYLCLGETVTNEPVLNWYIVTVYEDLSGTASVTEVKVLDLADIKTVSQAESGLVGSWKAKKPQLSGVLTEESENALNKALNSEGQFAYTPIATLGTQIVAGTNYMILLQTENGESMENRVVTVYQDLSGNCSIISNAVLDITAYVYG